MGPAVTGTLPLAATLPSWSVIDQIRGSAAGAFVVIATGNAVAEAKMRPLCVVGVSAETSALPELALDVAGEPQLIVPAASADAFEAAALVPAFAALDPEPVFALVFALVPAAFAEVGSFELPEPPPPHAASTSDVDSNR